MNVKIQDRKNGRTLHKVYFIQISNNMSIEMKRCKRKKYTRSYYCQCLMILC